jgi:hypothetical protein
MGEIIIYNQALPSNQVRQVERYLAQKWGVTLSNTHPYFSVPAVMRPFNPLDISGLATWFDAADVRRMTLSGSNVNSWGDKANMDNSMNFVGTAGTLVSNSTNYPCVRFSGTSVYQSTLSNLTRANYFSDTSTCTTFAVVNTSSSSGVNGLFWNFVSTTNTANRVAFFTNPPSTLFWDAGGIASPRQTGLTLVTNSMRIYMFQRAGITLNFRQFGALTTTTFATNTPTIANEQYRITMSEGGAAWTGDIHEILWYNRALRDTEIWQVENYLANKWGLRASLTSNSPMRFYASLSPVFNPTLIPGCALWLDAVDTNSFVFSGGSTSNIQSWLDKSANGFHATASNNPTWSSSQMRVEFNGTTQYMSNTSYTLNLSQRSIFIVMEERTRIGSAGVFPQLPNPIGQNDYLSTTGMSIETNNGLRFYWSNGNYSSDIGNSVLLAKAIYNDNMSGINGSSFLNGSNTANLNATGTAGTCGGYLIGQRWLGSLSLSYPLNGFIYEILVYSSPLTQAQRRQVEGYLSKKWNIALSPNHPYYTIPV